MPSDSRDRGTVVFPAGLWKGNSAQINQFWLWDLNIEGLFIEQLHMYFL